jgi:hypothetical protein
VPDTRPHIVVAPPVAFVPMDGMLLAWPLAVWLAETSRQQGEQGNEVAGQLANKLAVAIIEAEQEAMRCSG